MSLLVKPRERKLDQLGFDILILNCIYHTHTAGQFQTDGLCLLRELRASEPNEINVVTECCAKAHNCTPKHL